MQGRGVGGGGTRMGGGDQLGYAVGEVGLLHERRGLHGGLRPDLFDGGLHGLAGRQLSVRQHVPDPPLHGVVDSRLEGRDSRVEEGLEDGDAEVEVGDRLGVLG